MHVRSPTKVVNSISVKNENQNKFFQNVISLFTISCAAVWGTTSSRAYIKVTTRGGTSDWLYDPGASVTCMSQKAFRLIPHEFRPEKLPNTTKLVDAQGNNIPVLGVYNLEIKVHNRTISSPVFVCQKLHSNAILGMDVLSKMGICHAGDKKSFFFSDILDTKDANKFVFQSSNKNSENFSTGISTIETVKIPPMCHATVCLNSQSEKGYSPPPGTYGISHISSNEFPNLTSNSGVTEIDKNGHVYVQVFNSDLWPITIPRAAVLGELEIVNKDRLHVVDKQLYLASIEKAVGNDPPPSFSSENKDYVLQNVKISVPENEKQKYIDLLNKNLDVFSKNESDLGCANHFKHKIDLNNKNPIYVKQFRIAEAYRAGLFEQVKTWLALGVIKPSQSKYNNPIFVVPKKTGKPRYVLDYRQLNKASVEDKYSMRTVDECIADIGYAGSFIFSIIEWFINQATVIW